MKSRPLTPLAFKTDAGPRKSWLFRKLSSWDRSPHPPQALCEKLDMVMSAHARSMETHHGLHCTYEVQRPWANMARNGRAYTTPPLHRNMFALAFALPNRFHMTCLRVAHASGGTLPRMLSTSAHCWATPSMYAMVVSVLHRFHIRYLILVHTSGGTLQRILSSSARSFGHAFRESCPNIPSRTEGDRPRKKDGHDLFNHR